MDNDIAKRLTSNYLALTAWRVTLLYITLAITRFIFYCYNHDLIGSTPFSEFWSLTKGAFTFDNVSIVYSSSLWLLLSLLPIRARVKWWYQRALFWLYMTTTSLLLISLNICDAVYFHYAQKRFTASDLMFSDNDNNFNVALQAFTENWHIVLIAILVTLFVAKSYRYKSDKDGLEDLPTAPQLYYPINVGVVLATIALAIGGVRGGFTHDIRPLTLSNAMHYTADSEKSYMILSNPFCIIRTIGKSNKIEVPKYFNKEAADAMFSPLHHPTVSQSRYEGYNVVIFILESFSAENSAHLSGNLYKSGDQGYMPFLDSLMREGVTLRKMYANGTRSIAATPAILGSIPSFDTPFVLMSQSIAPSKQLPAMLRDRDYSTIFACGSSRSSMGFAAYAKSAGVDRYISREDYESKYGNSGFDGTWGIWDEEFIDYFGEVLNQTPKPLFASIFNISSHHPFEVPERYKQSLPKGSTAIHQCTAYTDMALRKFFHKYSKEEWFNKTIFAFVADHVSSEKMSSVTTKFPGNRHIVGAFYTPDGSLRAEINEVTQQIDLMPTILSLVGNDKPFFAFGRDIFSKSDTRPQWSVNYDGGIKAYRGNDKVLTIENCDTLKAFSQQYFDHISRRDYLY